jgi:hypothetical protein
MFRAFVDDGEPERRQAVRQSSSGPKVGLIVGVVVVVVILAVVAYLALA